MPNTIRLCRFGEIILLSLIVVAILDVSYVNCSHLLENSDETGRTKRDGELEGRVFNFGDIVPDIPLKLGDKRINVDNLVLSEHEADRIAPLLHGFPLADRVTAWGIMARIDRLSNNSPPESYDIEDLAESEDDIILTVEQLEAVYNGLLNEQDDLPEPVSSEGGQILTRKKRKIVAIEIMKWPKTIPWKFVTRFSTSFKANIRAGLSLWQSQTCLRFVEKFDRKVEPHIRFVDRGSCSSNVGMVGRNGQDITLTGVCNNPGDAAHEVGHALGLLHEQSRPDRDEYIVVNGANIQSGRSINFLKIDWTTSFTAGVPYDYASLMHYRAKAFTKNRLDTITTKWNFYEHTIGDHSEPSFYDVKAINIHYCSDACNETTLDWQQCEHDGYRDPNNCSRCVCQRGWAPPYCNTLMQNTHAGECGVQTLTAQENFQTIRLASFNKFPFRYPDNMRCVWKIKAPPAMRVLLTFSVLEITCTNDACRDYIEVRFADLSRIGPRFCCRTIPRAHFPSYGREMMLFFNSVARPGGTRRGFVVAYKYATCGGCHPILSTSQEPVCYLIRQAACDPYAARWICGYSICQLFRSNMCYKQHVYCCHGYDRVGSNCVRNVRISRITTTPLPPGNRDCASPRADIVFLLDVSDNVNAIEFQREKLFVEDILNTLQIGTDAFQVGVVTFSDTVHVELHLDENGALSDIIALVNKIPRRGGSAHTSEALEMVRQQSFSVSHDHPPNPPNILIVLTSGQSAMTYEPFEEAGKLHDAGVTVIALGTGISANITALGGIVSDPIYLYEDANFHALHGVINHVKLLACNINVVAIKPTTSDTTKTTTSTTIDGNWAPWSAWTGCSVTCGRSTRRRSRTCSNPPPSSGGADCRGQSSQTITCNNQPCPVDGNWAPWSAWTSCSVTCGGGTRRRSRTCSNPPRSNGGMFCQGQSSETITCNNQACPRDSVVDGGWTPWSVWSNCSATCGSGQRTSERSCTDPVPSENGAPCAGRSLWRRVCFLPPCPTTVSPED